MKFLQLVNFVVMTTTNTNGDLSNKGPQHLNFEKIGPFLKVEKDKLTVQYTGPGNQYQDVGSIRSNARLAAEGIIDYFEIRILNQGKRNTIMIGLTAENDFVSTKHPGWDSNGYGYQTDGKIFNNSKHGKAYGPSYEAGDVVGCGLDYSKKELFFTKNGKHLGVAFSNLARLRFYPTVGLHSPNERIVANFVGPFKYDLESACEERTRIIESINETSQPVYTLNTLIRDYLYYEGYTESLSSFEQDLKIESKIPNEPLMKRREICSLIERGRVEEALKSLILHFPETVQLNPVSVPFNADLVTPQNILFRIHCQTFIEIIKNGDLLTAIEWARVNLGSYMNDQTLSSTEEKLFLDTVGLLAYETAVDSPSSYLLQDDKRSELSQDVNKLILKSLKQDAHSGLERIYMQLAVCKDMLGQESVGCGDVIKLNL
ncbi:Ran-binding protein [Acrasis kona]|uniref:Ran-binding protein n=1 Tax=Acrasis kona TaxID=1008807 RepID=A0AAW2YZ70_9EUKA